MVGEGEISDREPVAVRVPLQLVVRVWVVLALHVPVRDAEGDGVGPGDRVTLPLAVCVQVAVRLCPRVTVEGVAGDAVLDRVRISVQVMLGVCALVRVGVGVELGEYKDDVVGVVDWVKDMDTVSCQVARLTEERLSLWEGVRVVVREQLAVRLCVPVPVANAVMDGLGGLCDADAVGGLRVFVKVIRSLRVSVSVNEWLLVALSVWVGLDVRCLLLLKEVVTDGPESDHVAVRDRLGDTEEVVVGLRLA